MARYAQLLGSRASLPVFGAASATDGPGARPARSRSAFAGAPAPVRLGARGRDLAQRHPGRRRRPGARTHYAFDTGGDGGTVRVVVIDNSGGSLAASDPRRTRPSRSGRGSPTVLDDAAREGHSRDRDRAAATSTRGRARRSTSPRTATRSPSCSSTTAPRPTFSTARRRTARARSAGRREHGIPEFGTGTLGYRSSVGERRQRRPARRAVRRQRVPAAGGPRVGARPEDEPRAGNGPPDPGDRRHLDAGGRRRAAAAQPPGAVPGAAAQAGRRRPLGAERRRRAARPVGRRPVHDGAGRARASSPACTTRISARVHVHLRRTPTSSTSSSRTRTPRNLRKPLLGADDKVVTDGGVRARVPVQRRARRS